MKVLRRQRITCGAFEWQVSAQLVEGSAESDRNTMMIKFTLYGHVSNAMMMTA